MFNATLVGNAGDDAVVKYVKVRGEDKAVATFSLAVSTGKDTPPVWYRCTAWGNFAEKVVTWVKKGDRVAVSTTSPIKVSLYTDKNGNSAASLEVTIDSISLPNASERSGSDRSSATADSSSPANTSPGQPDFDDIPF